MSFYIKNAICLKSYELGDVSFHMNGVSLINSPKAEEIKKILISEARRKTSLVKFVIKSNDSLYEIINSVYEYLLDHELSVGLYLTDDLISGLDKEFINNKGIYLSSSIEEDDLFEDGSFSFKCCGVIQGEGLTTKLKPGSIKKSKIVVKDISFNEKLIKYLNKSNKTNVEVYQDGGITRKLFSKILSKDTYIPKKDTILCLIVGMELCLDDALDLLNAAGFTLSNSIVTDIIIKEHIESKTFDIELINSELDANGQIPIGWKPREE